MNRAEIHDTATIGAGAQIGAFSVIGAGVKLGKDCVVGNHVVIHEGTTVGENVRIDDHAVVGKQPMRSAASAVTTDMRQPPAILADGVIVGTHAVLYAGCQIGPRVLIADLATVREDVQIGERTIVGRGVAIENACRIGARCKLETNAYITAYSTLEDDVFVAPGALTSNDNFLGRTEERFAHFGGVTVHRGGRIGVGAVILPNRIVETEAVVAAGAVLTKDAPSGTIVAGIPARPLRPVPLSQKLDTR
jgi:UDP-2-acetamido-3-amino-2,3-dideoxy-glucuronate N-acetyltransferase